MLTGVPINLEETPWYGNTCSTVIKSPVFRASFYYILAVCPWASSLTSLGLNFLV